MNNPTRYITGINDEYPAELRFYALRNDYPTMIARGATLGQAISLLGAMFDTLEQTGHSAEPSIGEPVTIAETVALAETVRTRHEFGGRVA
jgi:hypothetical protein